LFTFDSDGWRGRGRRKGREMKGGGIELGSGLVTTNSPKPDESDLGGSQLYFCFGGELNGTKEKKLNLKKCR